MKKLIVPLYSICQERSWLAVYAQERLEAALDPLMAARVPPDVGVFVRLAPEALVPTDELVARLKEAGTHTLVAKINELDVVPLEGAEARRFDRVLTAEERHPRASGRAGIDPWQGYAPLATFEVAAPGVGCAHGFTLLRRVLGLLKRDVHLSTGGA